MTVDLSKEGDHRISNEQELHKFPAEFDASEEMEFQLETTLDKEQSSSEGKDLSPRYDTEMDDLFG